MENSTMDFTIKALDENEAIKIVKKDKNFTDDYIFEVNEIIKPKKILGLIGKKGTYNIIVKVNNKNKLKDKVENLIKLMDLDLEVSINELEEKHYLVDLNGKDNGIIIGKKGKTLNSFEYLLNHLTKGYKVEVDVEGFKEKRANTLRDLAKKMVTKVLKTDRAVKLNPMPPRERKIIHEVVNTFEGIDTYSEGKDPKRYIVIRKKRDEE